MHGEIKRKPKKYSKRLKGKTLLMLFAKPSLRTHLSFDVAMYQLGGHAIFYDLSHSVLGEKESIKDFLHKKEIVLYNTAKKNKVILSENDVMA